MPKKVPVLELYDMANGNARFRRGNAISWSVLTSSAAQPVTPSGPARAALIVKAEQGEAPAASDSAVHPRPQCPYSALHGRLRLELGPDVRPRQDHEGLHDLPKLCHCLHNLYPPEIRFAIVFDNFSSRHSTRSALGMGDWADVNNVELTGMRIHANRMNLMEGQFQALRYFTLDDTDHHSHGEQKVGCLALQPPPPPHRNEVAGEVATALRGPFLVRLWSAMLASTYELEGALMGRCGSARAPGHGSIWTRSSRFSDVNVF